MPTQGPLHCFIVVAKVKVCRLFVGSSGPKDKEEAEVEMFACVCMIVEGWGIFGVSYLVPTSVSFLKEEERCFLWWSQQHGHLVLMCDPYLQE